MKEVPSNILSELANRFGYSVSGLTLLGGGREDSDGIVYRAVRQGEPYVLKIVGAGGGHGVADVEARAAFFAFLGEKGMEVVSPKANDAGRLVEAFAVEGGAYLAYQYPYLKGAHPTPDRWTDTVIHAWGRTIGKAHRLTKQYPYWEGVPAAAGGALRLSWQAEMDGFAQWCKDAEVKAFWAQLRTRVEALEATRDTMGFVHNDPHMQNILLDENRIKLLDFDVAVCHFFACDLAIAIQSVLFTTGGGMDRPVQNQAAIDRFVEMLLEGYAQENSLPRDGLEQIELFIAYRRALLFTVMQDWLATQPRQRDLWKSRTLQAPPVLQLAK